MKNDYKGHKIRIERESDGDCVKAYHYVTLPGASKPKFADLDPYHRGDDIVKLWIDAGYPDRIGVGPLTKEALQQIIRADQIECVEENKE